MQIDEQSKKTLIGGVVVACLIIGGFLYYNSMILGTFYVQSQKKKEELGKEIKALNEELKQIREAEAQRDQIEQMRLVVAEAAKRLPDSPDAPGFYQELIRILRITGVFANRIDPREQRRQALYTEIPYELNAQCRYHEFGQFLNLIEENQSRFMRINALEVKNKDDRPSIHPVTIGISTFMFNR
ncbi:MAG TPA: type 4a pilus biogenesis protein PilO [Candidatus Sumerlaeota bacterium]|nr:type 4a pilus biogenesis protein PilO [Candidatus Sumerlaeota bacterium]